MKLATCVLIPVAEYFLSISRRGDNTLWGIPGGKVDKDESCVEAAVRELHEETGIVIHHSELTELFADVCPGDVDFLVTTYLYTGHNINSSTILKPELEFELALMSKEDLSNPQISPFAKYNCDVFTALKSLKGDMNAENC